MYVWWSNVKDKEGNDSTWFLGENEYLASELELSSPKIESHVKALGLGHW